MREGIPGVEEETYFWWTIAFNWLLFVATLSFTEAI